MLEFNNPAERAGRGPRSDLGFPRCVAFAEDGIDKLEEKGREMERSGEVGWGGDWEAVRERMGGYRCVNGYWCRAGEVEWPEE